MAKAKIETDSSQAGKGAGKTTKKVGASKALGKTMSSAPNGAKPDGNPTAVAKKGSPKKGKK